MKRILLVIHELEYAGTPIFAIYVSKILKRNNFYIEIVSLKEGKLRTEFELEGVKVTVLDEENIKRKVKDFDLLLAFSILTYGVVRETKYLIPTVWYIHEGPYVELILKKQPIRLVLEKTNNIWCVSEYAAKFFRENYHKTPRVLHNFVFDEFKEGTTLKDNKIKKFVVVGTIEERKGQDVLSEAFLALDTNAKKKCEIHFVGKPIQKKYVDQVLALEEAFDNVYYHGEVNDRTSLIKLYQECDVVVVPSREESCSLVTLEAMMLGKPVIVTQDVGAKYMVSESNGWVIETGNVSQLSKLLKLIVEDHFNLIKMGNCARESYLCNATEILYEKALLENLKLEQTLSVMVWRLLNYPLHLFWNRYCLHHISPFWNIDIPYGSKIILYGAGKNGERWNKKIKDSKYCKIIAWVDKYSQLNRSVLGLDKIKYLKFDYVLVTIKNRKIQEEVVEDLFLLGINKNKIICINE